MGFLCIEGVQHVDAWTDTLGCADASWHCREGGIRTSRPLEEEGRHVALEVVCLQILIWNTFSLQISPPICWHTEDRGQYSARLWGQSSKSQPREMLFDKWFGVFSGLKEMFRAGHLVGKVKERWDGDTPRIGGGHGAHGRGFVSERRGGCLWGGRHGLSPYLVEVPGYLIVIY